MGFVMKKEADKAKRQGDKGTVVHIHNADDVPEYYGPTGELPVTITVAGQNSERYRRAEDALRKKKIKKITKGMLYEDSLELAVACTMAWEGIFVDEEEKTPIEFSRHNVRQLYLLCPWVYDQVNEAMNDLSLFSESVSPSE